MNDSQSGNGIGRRKFGAMLAGAGVLAPGILAQQSPPPPQNEPSRAAPNPNTSHQRRGTMPEIPPFQGTITFTRVDVSPRVRPFAMTEVRVLGGPYRDAQEWNRGYLHRLEADRLVRNFLVNAGLPSSAKPLGDGSRIHRGAPGSCVGISRGIIYRRPP